MPVYLNVTIVNKDELIPKLKDILKDDAFCGEEPSVPKQLKELVVNLRDDVQFVLESPYVDRHYRDTYYSFHSSKFKKTGRNCVRVHIFEGKITGDDLYNNKIDLDERYLGFFIIRPLPLYILGRSLISPKALQTRNFVCCLMKTRVSLLGNEFTAHGFPHIAQDTETHTCAESALWNYVEYFGQKYHRYKPLLPSQIVTTLLDSEHRILPSEGLTEKELAKCLNVNGFQCLIYYASRSSDTNLFFQLLRIYVESGIPLLLKLANEENAHAVLTIGHETDKSLYDAKKYFSSKGDIWVDASLIDKKFVFIDDNLPPYKIADLSKPADYYSDPKMKNLTIKAFIVSLPVHMFLVAEKAYALIQEIFYDQKVGLQTFGGKWVSRLLLTGNHSFKKFIYDHDDNMPNIIREGLLHLALPRFIWIAELYKEPEFNKNGYCSGLLIIDATGNGKTPASVLWYMIDNNLFIYDNGAWDIELDRKETFKMNTYKNNLKGEWDQWKS